MEAHGGGNRSHQKFHPVGRGGEGAGVSQGQIGHAVGVQRPLATGKAASAIEHLQPADRIARHRQYKLRAVGKRQEIEQGPQDSKFLISALPSAMETQIDH